MSPDVILKIDAEKRKSGSSAILEKLEEQKGNIIKLKERQASLSGQISLLKSNFNSVYTKITLLDTTDKVGFDEIETEIHKILDFKLKVSNYEEQLDREMK